VLTETRYALNGDLHIAYRTTGEGPRDIVFVSNWFLNVETFPELPSIQPWLEKMTTLGRVIFFDQPGTGISDPVSFDSPPTLEQWTDGIGSVLNAIGADEAVLLAIDGSFATAALFAATYPARTTALIALEGYAQSSPDESFSSLPGLANIDEAAAAFGTSWGTGELQHLMNPEMPWNEEIRSAWARQERIAASPRTVAMVMPLLNRVDVTSVLPAIRVPSLVIHDADDPLIPVEMGRYIARHIPGARMAEISCRNIYPFVEPGWRRCFEEISEFLTGTRAPVEEDRVLATVLFTDIVDSTGHAAAMGDRDWRALLDAHDAVVRAQLSRFRGREVSTAGDSFLATFDGPQRAIRCAVAIREAVRALGIEVRAGLHTGECEVRRDPRVRDSARLGGRLRDRLRRSWIEGAQRRARRVASVRGDRLVLAAFDRAVQDRDRDPEPAVEQPLRVG
jgi:pimeloyl-ACP methyl ester carboxylesterase